MSTDSLPKNDSRRSFLTVVTGASAALVGLGLGSLAKRVTEPAARADAFESSVSDVVPGEDTPLEDLMREHAILERVLLAYDESAARLDANEDVFPDGIARAAKVVRRYIEEHHERDEEKHIFPRLTRVGACKALVPTLLAQHEAGRALTREILSLAAVAPLRDATLRRHLVTALRSYSRMYRPHAAHENTVIFPAFRKAVPETEYLALRDQIEREERATVGPHFYEAMVAEVVLSERALGIGDLASFTPGAGGTRRG